MSKLSKTLKAAVAFGAVLAMATAAAADDKKPKPRTNASVESENGIIIAILSPSSEPDQPDATGEIEQRPGNGGTAGKVSFKDFALDAPDQPDAQPKDKLTNDTPDEVRNAVTLMSTPQEGCEPYPTCARNEEWISEDVKREMAADNEDGGIDVLTWSWGAKAPSPADDIDTDEERPQGGDDPIPGIDIIVKCDPGEC